MTYHVLPNSPLRHIIGVHAGRHAAEFVGFLKSRFGIPIGLQELEIDERDFIDPGHEEVPGRKISLEITSGPERLHALHEELRYVALFCMSHGGEVERVRRTDMHHDDIAFSRFQDSRHGDEFRKYGSRFDLAQAESFRTDL